MPKTKSSRTATQPVKEIPMRRLSWLMLVPVAAIAMACDRGAKPAIDDALKNDLALASQSQAYNPQQFLGPAEAGYGAQQQYAPRAIQTVARQPVSTARRTTTARRSSGSNGGYYPAPAQEQVVRNTKRDAIIGAAAGAVIGAVSSRDKVKGGVIGAAAGGILGAVVGSTVDVQRKRGW
jgi:hypothetical protein